METESRQRRNRVFLKILFEGTTSHNSRAEILGAFDQIEDWPQAPQVCAYYQGCGCDLVTLACRTVDIHVLSDTSSDVVNQLAGKFKRLADERFITDLQDGDSHWRFAMDGRAKDVYFTTRPIDGLDFRRQFSKPLGIVFEWNCGDSAQKESFWEALSRELVDGGHVMGSHAPDLVSRNRDAFVLCTSDKEPMLHGLSGFDHVDSEERTAVLSSATALDIVPKQPLEWQVLEVGAHAYALCWGGRDRTAVTRIWRRPLRTFGLQLISVGDHICRLVKRDETVSGRIS